MRMHVVEIPRRTRPLFESDVAACLKFVADRTSSGMTRFGLAVAAPRRPKGQMPSSANPS